jgi:hypothetical protein
VKFSREFSAALEESLALLAAAFHNKLTPLEVKAYAIGLEGIKAEYIRIATKYLLRTHREFMPTPAQFREALKIALESISQAPVPDCPDCYNTGFVVELNESTGGKLATLCHCRKPSVPNEINRKV